MKIDNVSSERVDKRVLRTYGLKLTVPFYFADEDQFCTRCRDEANRDINFRLDDITEGLPFLAGTYHTSTITNYNQRCSKCSWQQCIIVGFTTRFYISAGRPKEILGEGAALNYIAVRAPENEGREHGSTADKKPYTLEEILEMRTRKRFALWEQEILKSNIARQATHLARWAANNADEAARKAVDFEARLEALKAELKAEQARQLNRVLLEELGPAVERSEEDFHPLALQLAVEPSVNALPAPIPSILCDTTSQLVKPADVELPEDAAKVDSLAAVQ